MLEHHEFFKKFIVNIRRDEEMIWNYREREWDFMKKKFFSLKFKTGLIFTILILIVLFINAIATIKQIKGINKESYGREALSVIKTINCNIDGDKFEELVKTKNDKTQ